MVYLQVYYIIHKYMLSSFWITCNSLEFIKNYPLFNFLHLTAVCFCDILIKYENAGVVELADALDSKSCGSDTVSVRPRSPAPYWALSHISPISIRYRVFYIYELHYSNLLSIYPGLCVDFDKLI